MASTATTTTQNIRVEVKQRESGMLYASSPDIRGLLVAKRTREALEAAIPEALTSHFEFKGLKVVDVHKAAGDQWTVVTSEALASVQ